MVNFKFMYGLEFSKSKLQQYELSSTREVNGLYNMNKNTVLINLLAWELINPFTKKPYEEYELIKIISRTICHEYLHSAIFNILGYSHIERIDKEEEIINEVVNYV